MARPRTALELNIFHINKKLKKLQEGETENNEIFGELNRRFDRLKKESEPWYEEMYPKYISIVKQLNA